MELIRAESHFVIDSDGLRSWTGNAPFGSKKFRVAFVVDSSWTQNGYRGWATNLHLRRCGDAENLGMWCGEKFYPEVEPDIAALTGCIDSSLD